MFPLGPKRVSRLALNFFGVRVDDLDHGQVGRGRVGHVGVPARRVEGHALGLVPDLDLLDDLVLVGADDRDAVVARVDRPHELAVERHRDRARVGRAGRRHGDDGVGGLLGPLGAAHQREAPHDPERRKRADDRELDPCQSRPQTRLLAVRRAPSAAKLPRRAFPGQRTDSRYLGAFTVHRYPSGLTAVPFTRTSKCRWTPVEWPVVPMPPTTVPCPTAWPTETARLDMWP